MGVLTEIKKLADCKSEQYKKWKEATSINKADYAEFTDSVKNYNVGDLDAAIISLSVLEGAGMPDAVKELLLNYIKNGNSLLESVDTLTSSLFSRSDIIYCKSLSIGSTDMSRCFNECSLLYFVEPLDFSSVTKVNYLFYNCINLQVALISDLSSAENGEYAFYNCANLKSLNFDNLTSLTKGDFMFYNCSKLSELPFNAMPELLTGKSMFSFCLALKSVSLDLPKLETATGFLNGCSLLKNISITDLSNLKLADSMMQNCVALKSAQLPELPSLTSAIRMFNACSALTSLPELYMPAVLSIDRIFAACSSLSSVSFKAGSLVVTKTMYSAFNLCSSLQSIDGLCLSGLYLDLSDGITEETYTNSNNLILPSSLVDCELQGTLYRSGLDLRNCTKLSAKSLFTWVAALYDWETNEESKTTIDLDHTLYLTASQQSTLEEYEGDGTKTGAEVIEQAIMYGWNLSE